MHFETPVVVVGAGPAGATASLFLSKWKVPHILLEKATFPRDKVCGDGLTLEVQFVLRSLYGDWLDELRNSPRKFLPSWGLVAYAPNNRKLHFNFQPEKLKAPPFLVSSRVDFDAFLVEKVRASGADFREGVSIEKLERVEENKVLISGIQGGESFSIVTDLVLAADGASSWVERQLAPQYTKIQPFANYVSVRGYFEQVDGVDWERADLEFFFLEETLPGYFWIFPVEKESRLCNVGVILLSEDVQAKKLKVREMFPQIMKSAPFRDRFQYSQLRGEVKGWSLPLNTHGKLLSGDNFLLLGDAGALIEPFSGKGIGIAMISGKMAAEMARKAIQENDFSATFLHAYHQRIYSYFKNEWKLLAWFQKKYSNPKFINRLTTLHYLPGVKRLTMWVLHRWLNKWL